MRHSVLVLKEMLAVYFKTYGEVEIVIIDELLAPRPPRSEGKERKPGLRFSNVAYVVMKEAADAQHVLQQKEHIIEDISLGVQSVDSGRAAEGGLTQSMLSWMPSGEMQGMKQLDFSMTLQAAEELAMAPELCDPRPSSACQPCMDVMDEMLLIIRKWEKLHQPGLLGAKFGTTSPQHCHCCKCKPQGDIVL